MLLRKFINSSKYEEYCEQYFANYDKLFDNCSCKCKGHSCTYPREKIVLVSEVSFLKDQRSIHSMCIQTQSPYTSIQSKVRKQTSLIPQNISLVLQIIINYKVFVFVFVIKLYYKYYDI